MIEIRPEQLEAFGDDYVTDFKRRLVKHLRKHHAEKTKPYTDDEMMNYCDQAIERAKFYDLTTEKAIACYAQLQWLLGFDFESKPTCRYAVVNIANRDIPQNNRAQIALALAYQFHSRGLR